MNTRVLLFILAVFFAGCRNRDSQADAYGNFEATEVIVSSETSGRILRFAPPEGSIVEKGGEIALIDTSMFHLQKAEVDAAMKSVNAKINSIIAQNGILEQQISNLNINIVRIEKMLKDDAATQKQYDDLTGQVAVLEKQISANNAQKVAVATEIIVYNSKKATIDEQINRSHVKSPVTGTLIEKYLEEGEFTTAGKPLCKIANLDLMILKVYVDGAMIGSIKIGQECTVRIDEGEKGYKSYIGTVSYVSDKAEFTPKIIQTKEERATLVYAVNITVRNDGTLKSGMPGEAIFTELNK